MKEHETTFKNIITHIRHRTNSVEKNKNIQNEHEQQQHTQEHHRT